LSSRTGIPGGPGPGLRVLLKFGFCLTLLDDTHDLCLIIYGIVCFVVITISSAISSQLKRTETSTAE